MKALSDNLCVYCWTFLDIQALATLERVCREFRTLLNSQPAASLFEQVDISQTKEDPSPRWLLRKVITFQPRALVLSSCELAREEIRGVLQVAGGSLRTLDLSFTQVGESDMPELLSLCPHLTDLRLDRNCKTDSVLSLALRQLPALQRLSVRYNSFLKGKALMTTAVTLESLAIEECQNFGFEPVMAVASRSGRKMKELSIDGEAYSTEEVCRLVSAVPCLKAFSISFANELTDPILASLCGYALESLHIKKGLLLTSSAIQRLFSVPYPLLKSLELIECGELGDCGLVSIAENCPNLRFLNLSWCTEVADEGLREVVRRCFKLRRLELVGLKSVTDASFPLDEDLPIYENLLSMNFTKSDYVSDEHLMRISVRYPQIQLKNYYGEGRGNWRCAG